MGNAITRRRMITGLGAGLATVATPRLFEAPENSKGDVMTTQKLEDPKTKYPKPPFREQSQPWPGLAGKMEPPPDHGEKSYRGSGRLLGRKALITGGDSGMGRGAAIAFAREGADVAINYFPTEQPDANEVVALIKQAAKPSQFQVISATKGSAPKWSKTRSSNLGDLTFWFAMPRDNKRTNPSPNHDRRFRRDDKDQYLRAVLDH